MIFSLSQIENSLKRNCILYIRIRETIDIIEMCIFTGEKMIDLREKKNCLFTSTVCMHRFYEFIRCAMPSIAGNCLQWFCYAAFFIWFKCKQIKMQNEFESRTLILIPMFNFKHVCNKLYMQTYQVQMIGDTLQFFVYEIEL